MCQETQPEIMLLTNATMLFTTWFPNITIWISSRDECPWEKVLQYGKYCCTVYIKSLLYETFVVSKISRSTMRFETPYALILKPIQIGQTSMILQTLLMLVTSCISSQRRPSASKHYCFLVAFPYNFLPKSHLPTSCGRLFSAVVARSTGVGFKSQSGI